MATIRQLHANDDRSRFRSGDPDLDRFLAKYAAQNQFRHHIGVTYVAVDDDDVIVGYLTVAAASLEADHLPTSVRKKLPLYPLPVLRVARLATDERFKGRGIGKALLRYAFTLAQRMEADYGCIGVVVDAKQDAVGFYEGYGFDALEVLEGESPARPKPTPMFLSLKEINAAAKT
jgi:GNAT superfamily N-acetyltransferase